jgi:hypothetical protein
MTVLIIGGKKLNTININLISEFDKICRVNINIQGEVKDSDIFYVNNHVFDNFFVKKLSTKRLLQIYNKITTNENIENFINKLTPKKSGIKQYESGSNVNSNKILSKIGCPFKFKKNPRCGYQSILYFMSKESEIFVTGFSSKTELNKTNCNNTNINPDHDPVSELKILHWLHNNNKIDITPCLLSEYSFPVFECFYIKPKFIFIYKCLKVYGISILKDFYLESSTTITEFSNKLYQKKFNVKIFILNDDIELTLTRKKIELTNKCDSIYLQKGSVVIFDINIYNIEKNIHIIEFDLKGRC